MVSSECTPLCWHSHCCLNSTGNVAPQSQTPSSNKSIQLRYCCPDNPLASNNDYVGTHLVDRRCYRSLPTAATLSEIISDEHISSIPVKVVGGFVHFNHCFFRLQFAFQQQLVFSRLQICLCHIPVQEDRSRYSYL